MGPSEDMNPTTYDEEQLQQEEDGSKIQGVSSNGTHHHLDEEQVLAQEFESLVLQGMTNDTHMMMMVMEDKKLDDQVVEEEEGKSQLYPLRPYAEDCSFYIKTGSCKFGQNCRFNHPSDRVFQYQGKGSEESNGTIGDTSKIDCKYFRTAGGCRYGDSCRYKHSARKLDNEGPDLNFLGLPIRPSEQECAFYLRNGSCGYGANCRFNHPDPTAVKESEPKFSTTNVRARNSYPKMYANEPFQSSGVSQGISDLSNGLNLMNGLPYAAMNYYQAVPQHSGWNQDQANLPSSVKMPLPHQIFNNSQKSDPSTHYEQVIQSEEFPLRPGQPDCDYFMKTGDCKYRADCRFNHPVRRSSKLRLPQPPSKAVHSTFKSHELPSSNPVNTRRNGMLCHQQPQFLNGTYPERPGQPECEFFMKTGNCKFKAACKYHHPKDRTSTPSCADNEGGIYLRPGAKICRNYEQQGTCKYGQNCRYHHPDNISPETADNISPETADHVPQDASEVENHSSSKALTPVTLESSSNMESDWGDGWVL